MKSQKCSLPSAWFCLLVSPRRLHHLHQQLLQVQRLLLHPVLQLVLGSDCKTQNVVGADPCAAVNKDWCCYYTSSQIGDGAKYEAYTCTTNPSVLSSLLDSASSLVSKATTDSSSEAKVEAYCANSVFMRFSAALFAFAALSFFFWALQNESAPNFELFKLFRL